jgi:hypothetical protein
MDYTQNYFNVANKAEEIRSMASVGRSGTRGLATRDVVTAGDVYEGYDTLIARYFTDTQDLFSSVMEEKKKRAEDIQSYLDVPKSSPFPMRNPENWKDAPLLSEITTEVTDENVRLILETIKTRESSGDYRVQNEKGSASGGYQFIDDTWRAVTSKYGVGTEYKSAKEAPPEVQDLVAAAYVKDILAENNNDITKVPVVWYTGNARGEMSEKALAVNNYLTPAEYQNNWMRTFNKISGGV